MLGPLLFDAAGRIRNTTSAPTAFNAGVGSVGGLLSATLAAPGYYHNGLPFATVQGFLSAQAADPTHYSNGIPMAASGAVAIDIAGAITSYSNGLPFTAAGRLAFAAAVVLTFVQRMSVQHVLTVGTNGANRFGYRRDNWGDFQPNDVPALSRLFTNQSNNRLIVQGDGDLSALPVAGIHIRQLPGGVPIVFGPPNSQLFDGVFTDFLWIVPFDFILGEQYEVNLL